MAFDTAVAMHKLVVKMDFDFSGAASIRWVGFANDQRRGQDCEVCTRWILVRPANTLSEDETWSTSQWCKGLVTLEWKDELNGVDYYDSIWNIQWMIKWKESESSEWKHAVIQRPMNGFENMFSLDYCQVMKIHIKRLKLHIINQIKKQQ